VAKNSGTDPYNLLLDPDEVLAHPSNVREDLGDIAELTKTITDSEVGLVQFPVLTPDGGGFRVVAGHRRLAAARQAGRKQWCTIRPDLAGKDPEQVAAMLNENTHRQALTPAEEAKGYAQLAMFEGWTPERIAKQTGRAVGFVKSQLVLANLPSAAHLMAAEGQLSLEDAAALEQFAGEPKVMERILRKGATPSGVRHVIAEEQRKRTCTAEAKAKIEALAKAGAVIIVKPKGYPYECREVGVTNLADADGNRLDPDEVVLKPGFAAFVWSNGGYPRVEVVCLNPAASGYHTTGYLYTRYESPEEKAAKERERVAAERLKEALATAAEVRQRHITEVYGNAKAIKDLIRVALRAAASDPRGLDVDHRIWPLLQTLAGVDPDTLPDNASADRINRVIVARWLIHQEYAVIQAGNGWGNPATAAAFLDRLSTTGYSLSEAEATLLDKLRDRLTPAPLPRETPGQLDRPCEDCGADIEYACGDDCPLREDEPADTAHTIPEADADLDGEADR
jgi:ParB family chromosome partitioning protein